MEVWTNVYGSNVVLTFRWSMVDCVEESEGLPAYVTPQARAYAAGSMRNGLLAERSFRNRGIWNAGRVCQSISD
ncbi:unnamed protein product, partial [Iphiclides podalirius]